MLEELNDNLQHADGQEQTASIEENVTVEVANEIEIQEPEVTENESASQDFDVITPVSAQDEIDNHLAEASEDGSIHADLEIVSKDYDSFSLEELVEELTTLVGHEKALFYKNQIEDVKKAFLNHYHQMIEEKRTVFYTENGRHERAIAAGAASA